MFLLDTMVVSEMRRRVPDSNVARWLGEVDIESLFVSAISFGEVAAGLEKKDIDPVFQARLVRWLEEIRVLFASRTLAIDTAVAVRWARCICASRGVTWTSSSPRALEHDLTLVTRYVRHFEPTGVKLFNPYEPQAA